MPTRNRAHVADVDGWAIVNVQRLFVGIVARSNESVQGKTSSDADRINVVETPARAASTRIAISRRAISRVKRRTFFPSAEDRIARFRARTVLPVPARPAAMISWSDSRPPSILSSGTSPVITTASRPPGSCRASIYVSASSIADATCDAAPAALSSTLSIAPSASVTISSTDGPSDAAACCLDCVADPGELTLLRPFANDSRVQRNIGRPGRRRRELSEIRDTAWLAVCRPPKLFEHNDRVQATCLRRVVETSFRRSTDARSRTGPQ